MKRAVVLAILIEFLALWIFAGQNTHQNLQSTPIEVVSVSRLPANQKIDKKQNASWVKLADAQEVFMQVPTFSQITTPIHQVSDMPQCVNGHESQSRSIGIIDGNGEIGISGSQPVRLLGQDPAYPSFAKAQEIEGSVKVKIYVDRLGQVDTVTVLEGDDRWGFVSAVVSAVKLWRFDHIYRHGQPISFFIVKTFNFVLN